MKSKISILILASSLMLLALSLIQAYLIHNTYQLKKKAFIKETSDAISNIDDHKDLDSLYALWGDDLKHYIADYKNNRIDKAAVVSGFRRMADSINPVYISIFTRELNSLDLGYDVDFKINISNLMLLNPDQNDTIFSQKTRDKIRLFGGDFDGEEAQLIKTAKWFSEQDYVAQKEDSIEMDNFELEVKTESFILIKDWKSIVYGRMSMLLVGSILLFLVVVGLLYYSIRNLISQKKIAEIKTDFINNITHELKTPLATLSIATKSLKNKEIQADAEAFESTLKIVDRQNDRLQKLIDQVMTNSLSSEELVIHKEQVGDHQFIDSILADFKLSNKGENLTIHHEKDQKEVLLRLDQFHFTTALLNILENAVKYGKKEVDIKVISGLQNGYYSIRIQDNGLGIPERKLAHLFDKFYRANEGDIHDVKGLGLGLYYTRQIVKAHQGSISVKSTPGKGSEFSIKIPVR